MIHGENFLIRDAGAIQSTLMGFFINAHLEAATVQDAETQAIELVRMSQNLRSTVVNTPENPPRMFVEEIAELTDLTDWPEDCAIPLSGFVFYNDPDANWRKGT
ncbi:MAG: hypothetical protein ABIP76_10015 [Verrucomicrobiota bacterium]